MLKRIELKGFKSFADKTGIDFEKGVSCIVGPNGSGKSNITDAFRWVLGEQSYKSLRGKHMTDVIFNGTVSREPLGYAEVQVVLDNSNKMIDLPYEEVSLLRRLYRSGESTYSINGNTCRLKDIKEMFLDTGVGVEGYSIIGQGRIDKLLSSGKEDRRAIFEEASGIAKYKSKKEEAERKLARTQIHMDRIEDIIAELELRVNPLKEQSEKALRHISIKDDLKSVEISLYLEEIDKIKSELATLEKDMTIFEVESEGIAGELFKLKDKAGSLSIKINELKLKKQELIDKKNELEKEKIQKEGYLKLIAERKDVAKKSHLDLDEKIVGIEEYLEQSLNEVKANLLEKKEVVEKLEKEFDTKNSELESLQSKLALVKADKRAFFENISKIEIKRAELKILIQQAEKRLSDLDLDIKTSEEVKQGALSQLKDIQHSLNELEEKEKSFNLEKTGVESSISENRLIIDEIENQIYTLQTEKNEAVSKKEILENRIDNFEGLGESAREVLKKARNDEKIYGTVASLITIDKKYELALEQILGARSENIVCADFDSTKKYIDFLKKERLGRQTFLPLDSIRANDILDTDDFDGLCGHAMDFIDCDDEVEPAIRYLLYNVSFVDDLDAAKRARKHAPNGYKLVTLEGDVVNVGGSVSGGKHKRRRTGIFADKRRLEELNELVKQKDKELELAKSDREEKVKLIQVEVERLQIVQRNLDEMKHKIVSASAVLDSERKRLSGGFDAEKRSLEAKEKTLIEIEELRQSLEENQEAERHFRFEDEKSSTDTDGIKEKIEALRLKIAEMNLEINEKKVSLNKIEFDCKNKDFEFKNHMEKTESERKALARYKEERDVLLLQIDKNEKEYINQIDEIEKNKEESHRIIGDVNTVEEELRELGAKNNEDLRQYKDLESKLNNLKDKIYGIRINTSKLETRLESQEEGLWENYNLSYAGALEFKIDISYNKAKTLMRSYKKELEEIGDVNLLAIEEYKEVNDRYHFMLSQKTDLKDSMDKLKKIILDMDENMRITFKESLHQINEKFKTTFSDLFRGGMATIELADEEDILDSEIIINAQPPGKKLQTIELLSGGEKALTAIAILFAILQTKPAPFCILDEIEAALDDRNIALFSSFLTEYKRNSQFILISHRKGTIKIADALYGVTMKEKGVSEILSLRINDGEYEAV